ncbi:hypothetical protein [Bradyrhizobium frederickii]|uniref:hypothetical protein n=1 Tax=Bradyrhizobium frederickii TaxID=2560054 RepID=UPI001F48E5D5|nr:hypothetical protein [Bradyrhizobium frederickii]
MPPGKKTIIVLTKFMVSAGIIILVARDLDLSSLKADLLAVKLHLLALAMLLLFAQTFALCNRWILILRAIGVSLNWVAGWRIVLASAWCPPAAKRSGYGCCGAMESSGRRP